MHSFHLSDLHPPKVPYSVQLAIGEVGVFAVCIAVLVAYFMH
jgi:hypothetical protein